MTDQKVTDTRLRQIVHSELPQTIEFDIPEHGLEVKIEPSNASQFRGILKIRGEQQETKAILKFPTAIKGVLKFILDYQEDYWVNWVDRAHDKQLFPVIVNGVYFERVKEGAAGSHPCFVVFQGTESPVWLNLKEVGLVPDKVRRLFPDNARFVDPEGF